MSLTGYTPELADSVIQEVLRRWRFDQTDNLLTNPSTDEMRAHCLDALSEINAAKPVTMYQLDQIMSDDFDPRFKALLFVGTAKNILNMLVADWTANGFSMNVQEFSVEDRLDRYKGLYDQTSEDFTTRLENLKVATQVFVKGISSRQASNPLVRYHARNNILGNGRWR